MKIQEFNKEIEATYLNHFPASRCQVIYTDNLYPSISINCLLSANKAECINGYSENDLFTISFNVHPETGAFDAKTTSESELNIVTLEKYRAWYTINPDNKYNVYGNHPLPYRKVKGTPEHIIKAFDKFCLTLKSLLRDDLNNGKIHKNHVEIVTSKLK